MCIKHDFFHSNLSKARPVKRDVREKIIDLHKVGMGYKTISKKVGEKVTTVRLFRIGRNLK